jgi:hypothetical protein
MQPAMWFIEGDISKFFDRVNHSILCSLIHKRVRDKKVLGLIRSRLVGSCPLLDSRQSPPPPLLFNEF